MSTLYPAATDDATTLPNPSATSPTNSPSLSGAQTNQNDAIKAIEAKVGTGASTPVANRLLYGTGTGASAWTQLTSAQLAASVSDETGSGSLVFATSPTLITPKVDTINENTATNGVTIDGLNIKDGALNTPNSVGTAAIASSVITNDKMASGANMLGYTQITSSFSTTSTTAVQVTGLSTVVTIPSGSRRVKITGYTSLLSTNTVGYTTMEIWDGTVGSGTKLGQADAYSASSGQGSACTVLASHIPSAGSHTYNIGLRTTAGYTGTLVANGLTIPAFILVELLF